MKQTITGPSMPTASICINKSRLKVYNPNDPTYYMEKGQEFQIELFNPTSNSVLAKIYLNNNVISQGGLVLRPGERVFLDRYIDVAKRFKFDVYEVSNTSEVQKAIEQNGDFKVEFYCESVPPNSTLTISNPIWVYSNPITYFSNSGSFSTPASFTTSSTNYSCDLNLTGSLNNGSSSSNTSYLNNTSATFTSSIGNYSSNATLRSVKKSKTIETGRVEAGSQSDQKLQTVNKSFNYYPFHTVVYKLLPISQKVNTSDDISVKRYCPNCGAKQKPEYKFCPSCGNKA